MEKKTFNDIINIVNDNTFNDIVITKSLRKTAKLFYTVYPNDFIYHPCLKHWYEKEDKYYKNKLHHPFNLEEMISEVIPNWFDGYHIQKDVEFTSKRQLTGKDIQNEEQNYLKKIKTFFIFLHKESTLKKIKDHLKIFYSIDLPQSSFTALLETNCPIEQWIIIHIYKNDTIKNKYECKEIYDLFINEINNDLLSQPISIIAFGKKLSKLIGKSTISGNKRYYRNITIVKSKDINFF